MDLPQKGKYIEVSAYYTWMGEDGVCRTIVKPDSRITIVEARENSIIVQSFTGGDEKYPLIVDARNVVSMTREARDFLSLHNRPSPVTAIAIIVQSPLSRIIGNFFIGLNKSRVPSKLFATEKRALKWVKLNTDSR